MSPRAAVRRRPRSVPPAFGRVPRQPSQPFVAPVPRLRQRVNRPRVKPAAHLPVIDVLRLGQHPELAFRHRAGLPCQMNDPRLRHRPHAPPVPAQAHAQFHVFVIHEEIRVERRFAVQSLPPHHQVRSGDVTHPPRLRTVIEPRSGRPYQPFETFGHQPRQFPAQAVHGRKRLGRRHAVGSVQVPARDRRLRAAVQKAGQYPHGVVEQHRVGIQEKQVLRPAVKSFEPFDPQVVGPPETQIIFRLHAQRLRKFATHHLHRSVLRTVVHHDDPEPAFLLSVCLCEYRPQAVPQQVARIIADDYDACPYHAFPRCFLKLRNMP